MDLSERSATRSIVMVSSDYPPTVVGGAERQCQKLSAALVRKGRSVTVLTSGRGAQTEIETLDGVQIIRFPCRASPQAGGRRLPASGRWGFQVFWWIKKYSAGIAVLHAHQAKLNAFWAVSAGRRYGIPVVVKPGLAGPHFDLKSLHRKRFIYGQMAARSVVRQASRFVAISSEIASDLVACGVEPGRISLIPNGVERLTRVPSTHAERAEARGRLGIAAAAQVFVFTGRLAPHKNLGSLLAAFAKLRPEAINAQLVLVGDGDLRAQLQASACRLRIEAHVRVTGFVTDVSEYLRAADAFVLPSSTEGMSNALLEAMSVGVVPIASNVSGTTDIIEHGANGLLFDVSDPVGIETQMRAFVAAPPEWRAQIGQRAFETVATTYDIDLVAARYEEMYQQLEHEPAVSGTAGHRR